MGFRISGIRISRLGLPPLTVLMLVLMLVLVLATEVEVKIYVVDEVVLRVRVRVLNGEHRRARTLERRG